jgi:multiple sugar transport system permease protein
MAEYHHLPEMASSGSAPRGAGTVHRPAAEASAAGSEQEKPHRVRRWESHRSRERLAQLMFLIPAAIYMIAFFGYPVVKNFLMAFQKYSTSTFYTGEAPWIGLANYRAVVSSSVFTKALINTVLFTAGSIAGQFVIGLALAVFFRRRFPLNGLLRSLLLLPWLIPLIVSGAVWRWILDKDNGALNRFLAGIHLATEHPGWLTSTSLALVAVIMVNIWIGIPFNVTILYGGLQDIPEDLYEAASLDGASGWQRFRYVTWPLLRPVVSVVLVLGVVYTIKVLDLILGLTGGGPANASQTIATQSYHLSFQQFDFGQGAALGNILIAISLVFAIIYLRANRRAVDE